MADLVLPEDLTDFPGAPYPASVVSAASESIRSDAHWHIAPVVAETVTVDGSPASRLLLLPTLKIDTVTAVRVWDPVTEAWTARTGWRISRAGMLHHPDGWNYGLDGVEVTFTHGFPTCPADLLPVIAARCQRALADALVTQRSETVGQRTASESYNINRLQVEAGAVTIPARYVLHGRVA